MTSLRCRVGDMAVVVKSVCGNEGKVVRCIRFIGAHSAGYDEGAKDVWLIDRALPHCDGGQDPFISDARLRPIRPTDEPDEFLALVGVPRTVEGVPV